jgi:hypothetical protein
MININYIFPEIPILIHLKMAEERGGVKEWRKGNGWNIKKKGDTHLGNHPSHCPIVVPIPVVVPIVASPSLSLSSHPHCRVHCIASRPPRRIHCVVSHPPHRVRCVASVASPSSCPRLPRRCIHCRVTVLVFPSYPSSSPHRFVSSSSHCLVAPSSGSFVVSLGRWALFSGLGPRSC